VRPARGEQPDDVTLAHKVESIVFRDPRFPKGQINVNAEDGEVFLRGQVDDPELVRELERSVSQVPGVRRVENLLHLPGTPAPASHAGRLLG
jgi:osmotically-inducible protein OsmY